MQLHYKCIGQNDSVSGQSAKRAVFYDRSRSDGPLFIGWLLSFIKGHCFVSAPAITKSILLLSGRISRR